MFIDILADGPTLRQTSYAIIFPVAGALLLVFGVRRRLAWRRWNRADNDRLLHPTPERAAPSTDSGLRADLWEPSQPSSRGTALIVIGAVVLLLGIGHVLSYVATARVSNAVKADVGQCITNTDFEQRRTAAEPVDCERTDATVQLVSKGDDEASCPDGERDGALYPVLTSDVRTVCFVWNLREGHCYAVASNTGAVDIVRPADCTDPAANVNVAYRVDGPGKAAQECPTGGRTLTYHEPTRRYCFVAP